MRWIPRGEGLCNRLSLMWPGFPRRGEDGKSYFPRWEGLCKRPSLTAGEFVTSSTGERGILGESEKSEPNPISEAIKQGVTVRLGPIHFLFLLTIVSHRDRLLPPSLDDQ